MTGGVGGALKSFQALVNDWEKNQNTELKLNCKDGHWLVNCSCDLGVWMAPTPQPQPASRGPRKGAGSIGGRKEVQIEQQLQGPQNYH